MGEVLSGGRRGWVRVEAGGGKKALQSEERGFKNLRPIPETPKCKLSSPPPCSILGTIYPAVAVRYSQTSQSQADCARWTFVCVPQLEQALIDAMTHLTPGRSPHLAIITTDTNRGCVCHFHQRFTFCWKSPVAVLSGTP